MKSHKSADVFLGIFISVVMLAVLSSCESVDRGNDESYHVARTVQRLQRQLGLADAQASQVYSILMNGLANHIAREQVINQIFSVLLPGQQQRLRQILDFEQRPFGGRHHHNEGLFAWYPRSYQNVALPLAPQAAPQPLPFPPQPYGAPLPPQPVLAQTAQPIQQMNTMYNPRTGETFSSQFKYDPHTGEALQPRQ